MSNKQEQHVRSLLSHLNKTNPTSKNNWQGWHIIPLSGGMNNRLFRATDTSNDIVVKFTIQDERNRAEREYHSLLALQKANLNIAPKPLLLDTTAYHLPVVVQTWIEGTCLNHPPKTDEEWQALLQYYQTVHAIKLNPKASTPPKAYGAVTLTETRNLITQQLDRIPHSEQPTTLQNLIQKLDQTEFPHWTYAPITLCRIDPNVSNFIRTKNKLFSVDWEYSGWGDPAFDMADLMTHPQYTEIPTSQWTWVIQQYCNLAKDSTMIMRIHAYYKMLLVWWVARSARYLYEVSHNLDNRLVNHPPNWKSKTQQQYHHYLNLAESIFKNAEAI